MKTNVHIDELVAQWLKLQAQGKKVTIEELCVHCPELIPLVQEAIEQHEKKKPLPEGSPDSFRDDETLDEESISSEATASFLPPEAEGQNPAGGSAPDQSGKGTPDIDIEGYEVVRELGRGGMGVVYQAYQPALKRTVALKMILAGGHASDQHLQRFRIEAEAVARLKHPNIVQIYEIGDHNGLPFFSLEFCGGGALNDKLDGTPWDQQKAARLLEVLARAMFSAHDLGIVHRDLKPHNILLDENGTPKITDFGLAKKLEEEGVTQTEAIMGTPSYMAPEQAKGKTKEVGPGADVYALGAILYELITGRPPFKAASAWDTVNQVIRDDPVPPRQRNPKVSKDLQTICLKCLEKEPIKRYSSAEVLAEELSHFQKGEPIAARPVSQIEKLWRWAKRNKIVATLLVAVMLTLTGGAIVALVLGEQARTEATRAKREATRADKESKKAKEESKRANAKTIEANEKKAEAIQESNRARAQQRRAESLLYGSQLRLAFELWKEGNVEVANEVLDSTRWDLRHLEFRYLHTLFHRLGVVSLKGHKSPVSALASGPNREWIFSGSDKGILMKWSSKTGKALFSIQAHRKAISDIAIDAQCQWIVTASSDRSIKVWSPTGKLLQQWKTKATVSAVTITPNGNRILSAEGSDPGQLIVRDRKTGVVNATWNAPESAIERLALSPNGKVVVAAGWYDVVFVDVESGKALFSVPAHDEGANAIAYSPDGSRIATGGGDGTISVREAAKGTELYPIAGNKSEVNDLAFSPDGATLASATANGAIHIYDAGDGREKRILQGPEFWAARVCFDSTGKQIVSGGDDRLVKLWDLERGQQPLSLPAKESVVLCTAISPDGTKAICGEDDPRARLWDLRTGELIRSYGRPEWSNHVTAVAFDSTGDRIATGSSDGSVAIYNSETGSIFYTFRVERRHRIQSLCFSPNVIHLLTIAVQNNELRPLIIGRPASTVDLRDINKRKMIRSLNQMEVSAPTRAGFTHNGRKVALAASKEILILDVETGRSLRNLSAPRHITTMAQSKDGKTVVTASGNAIHCWEVSAGKLQWSSRRHTSPVVDLKITEDGERVLSLAKNGTLMIWNRKGQHFLTLRHPGTGQCLAISPDARYVVLGQGVSTGWDRMTLKPTKEKGKAVVLEATSTPTTLPLNGNEAPLVKATFSPEEDLIIAVDQNGRTTVWDRGGQLLPDEKAAMPETIQARSANGQEELVLVNGSLQLQRRWPMPSFEETLANQKATPQWHDTQAQYHEQGGHGYAARYHLTRLIELNPSDATFYIRRAYVQSQMARPEPALRDYLRALMLHPQTTFWPVDPKAVRRASTAAVNRQWQRAEQGYALAIRQPRNYRSWPHYLLCLIAQGKQDQFEQSLAEAIAAFEGLSPNSLHWSSLLKVAGANSCSREAAVGLLPVARRWAAQKPSSTRDHVLGTLLYRVGRYDDAVAALKKALELSKGRPLPETWLFLAMAYHDLGNAKASILWQQQFAQWRAKASISTTWYVKLQWQMLFKEADRVLASPAIMLRAED